MTLQDAFDRPGDSVADDSGAWELATTSLLLERLTGLGPKEIYRSAGMTASRLLARAAGQKRRAE